MIKNYFILNRLAAELLKELNIYNFVSAFTQEKDILMLEFSKDFVYKYIQVSLNAPLYYITFKNNFSRAKKNTFTVYETLIKHEVQSIEIAENDRIIKISLSNNLTIYIFFRGKNSNILFVNHQIISFKKTDDIDSLSKEIVNTSYVLGGIFPDIDDSIPLEEIKIKYKNIGKEIIEEAKYKGVLVSEIIKEIFQNNVSIFYDETINYLQLFPSSFEQSRLSSYKEFDRVIDATNEYLKLFFISGELFRLKKTLLLHLLKEKLKLEKKLKDLEYRLALGSREEEFQKKGNLILINLYKIKRGMTEIEVDDVYTDESIKIKLSEKLDANENAAKYFERAHDEKTILENTALMIKQLINKFESTTLIIEQIENSNDLSTLKDYIKKFKLNKIMNEQSSDNLSDKFKQYIIEDKYKVFVGRDSTNNDLLTVKFAKQNDYWFHARAVPGSHVVLRVDNTKEPLQKSVLKKAASLAAYHSKAKTAGTVPVSYTLKKHVVKKKGMAAGKVALMKEEVLLVKPEIPEGVVFITE